MQQESGKSCVLETTFKEKLKQFVASRLYYGGVTELIKRDLKPWWCCYQPETHISNACTKLAIVKYQGGLSYMRYSISDTAEYGDWTEASSPNKPAG